MKEEKKRRLYVEERMAEINRLKGDMTYKDYFEKDYNEAKETLKQELKSIEDDTKNIALDIEIEKKKGVDLGELHKIFHSLNDRRKKIEKEMSCKQYDADLSVRMVAGQLDRLEIDRQNMNDINSIIDLVNKMGALIKDIEVRSGGLHKTPLTVHQIWGSWNGIVNCLSGGIHGVDLRSKDTLENTLVDELDKSDGRNQEKQHTQSIVERWKAKGEHLPPSEKNRD